MPAAGYHWDWTRARSALGTRCRRPTIIHQAPKPFGAHLIRLATNCAVSPRTPSLQYEDAFGSHRRDTRRGTCRLSQPRESVYYGGRRLSVKRSLDDAFENEIAPAQHVAYEAVQVNAPAGDGTTPDDQKGTPLPAGYPRDGLEARLEVIQKC